MVNTHELELPLSRTNFPGSKGVRAIEVLLYIKFQTTYRISQTTAYDISPKCAKTLSNQLFKVDRK